MSLKKYEIVLATGNPGKVREFEEIFKELLIATPGIKNNLKLLSPNDFPDMKDRFNDISESGSSFKENALIKARAVQDITGRITMADDSGLVVDALKGAPGIYSKRYAGPDAIDEDNIEKLLTELENIPEDERSAHFVAVIVLVNPGVPPGEAGREVTVEGRCSGVIIDTMRGESGFGYDPIFFYPPLGKTFSEITAKEKNKISHRRKAIEGLFDLLPEFLVQENS